MKKTLKNTKIVLFSGLLAVMILSISGLGMVSAVSDKEQTTNTTDTNSIEQKIDELNKSIEEKQIQYEELKLLPANPTNNDLRNLNIQEISSLENQLEVIAPSTSSAYISDELKQKMDNAQMQLIQSNLPVFAVGIVSETGELNVKVDITDSTDLYDEIVKVVGNDIPLDIEYGTNTFDLQVSNCVSSSGACNPIIGGMSHDVMALFLKLCVIFRCM